MLPFVPLKKVRDFVETELGVTHPKSIDLKEHSICFIWLKESSTEHCLASWAEEGVSEYLCNTIFFSSSINFDPIVPNLAGKKQIKNEWESTKWYKKESGL